MTELDRAALRLTLRERGYARVPGACDGAALVALDEVTSTMIANWSSGPPADTDFWWYPGSDGRVLYRIHQFDRKQPDVVASALVAPTVRAILDAAFGEPAELSACALIVKLPRIGSPVPWHRDPIAVPPCSVYNVSVFLDDATPENGCLEVVPQSHVRPELRADGDRPAGSVHVPAVAGDAIVHDVRLLHGSGPNTGPTWRRSLVTEFQPRWIRVLVEAGRLDLHPIVPTASSNE